MRNEMDKYQVLDKLGSGISGVTFKVRNKITGEMLAMKCFPRGDYINENVEREIKIHRVLHHPHVIKFKEVVLDAFKLGIVMEFAENGQLRDQVLFRPFPEAKAREMFQMLIAGVNYIHSQDIYHRDLKLENILSATGDKLKICDFGLSKSLLLHSTAKSVVGTPIYCAPEVQTGSYDGKMVDVWSCGVTLYVMLTNRFQELSHENIISRCLEVGVSADCKNLLVRMLEKDPKKRITIEKIKLHPWYLENLPKDLKEPAQEFFSNNTYLTTLRQTEDDINKIIEKAKTLPKSQETEVEEKISGSFEEGKDGLEDNEQMKNGGEAETSSKKRKDRLEVMAEPSSSSQERIDGVEDNEVKRRKH